MSPFKFNFTENTNAASKPGCSARYSCVSCERSAIAFTASVSTWVNPGSWTLDVLAVIVFAKRGAEVFVLLVNHPSPLNIARPSSNETLSIARIDARAMISGYIEKKIQAK
jgi:hypothetical protein